MHIGSKGGDNDPLIAVFKLPVKTLGNDVFTGGIALTLHIGGVGQQCQNTLVAQLTQTGQVDHAVGGSGIDLKVAGHDHSAHGGVDGKAHSIGNGMVHMNKFHAEAACLYHITGLMGVQLYHIGQTVLLQLQLDQTAGHGGGVDGAVHLLHTVGDGTDMVFMTVGNKHAPQLLGVCDEVGKVRDHKIHTVHILIGEANAAIHYDHVFSVLQYGDILADLVQTAKRDDF